MCGYTDFFQGSTVYYYGSTVKGCLKMCFQVRNIVGPTGEQPRTCAGNVDWRFHGLRLELKKKK